MAMYNLGMCYHQGLGVPENIEKAIYLFKEAALKNEDEAKIAYVYFLLKYSSADSLMNTNLEVDLFIA